MKKSPPKPYESGNGGGISNGGGGVTRPMSGPSSIQRTISPGSSGSGAGTITNTITNTSNSVGGPLVTRPRTPMRPWENGSGSGGIGNSQIDSYSNSGMSSGMNSGISGGYRSSYGSGYGGRDSYSSGSGYGSNYGSGYSSSMMSGGGYGSSGYGSSSLYGGVGTYGSSGGYGSSGYGSSGYGSSGYGSSGYSSYGGGYGSSGYGGYGQSGYGGGYGQSGYMNNGPYGNQNHDGKGGALQSVVSSGHSWMSTLHSMVDTFSRFSRLLDANFDAVHGSFASIIRLCQSMSHFNHEILSIVKTFTLFKMFQSVASRFLKIFRYLLGRKSPASNNTNNTSVASQSITNTNNSIIVDHLKSNMDLNDFRNFEKKQQSVGKLILIIAVTFIGVPMLIGQLLNLRKKRGLDRGWQQHGEEDEDSGDNYGQVKAIYEFNPETTRDLPLRVGDIVNVIEKPHEGWWVGECNGLTGLFPSEFTRKISISEQNQQKQMIYNNNDFNNNNNNNNSNNTITPVHISNDNNSFGRNNSSNNLNNDYSNFNNNSPYQLQSNYSSSNNNGKSNNNNNNNRPISPSSSKNSKQLSRSEYNNDMDDKPSVEEF